MPKSPEGKYQPTPEEIQKAEAMMTKGQRRATQEREVTFDAGVEKGKRIEAEKESERVIDKLGDTLETALRGLFNKDTELPQDWANWALKYLSGVPVSILGWPKSEAPHPVLNQIREALDDYMYASQSLSDRSGQFSPEEVDESFREADEAVKKAEDMAKKLWPYPEQQEKK